MPGYWDTRKHTLERTPPGVASTDCTEHGCLHCWRNRPPPKWPSSRRFKSVMKQHLLRLIDMGACLAKKRGKTVKTRVQFERS